MKNWYNNISLKIKTAQSGNTIIGELSISQIIEKLLKNEIYLYGIPQETLLNLVKYENLPLEIFNRILYYNTKFEQEIKNKISKINENATPEVKALTKINVDRILKKTSPAFKLIKLELAKHLLASSNWAVPLLMESPPRNIEEISNPEVRQQYRKKLMEDIT